jgi:hypothetical protein
MEKIFAAVQFLAPEPLSFTVVPVYSNHTSLMRQGFLMKDLSTRLEAAALSLTGPGPIKDRLCDAYCSHLEDVREADLPAECGAEFAAMIQALHRVRALPGEHVVKASVRKLSNEEARRYAELVVRMYGMFAGMQYQVSAAARSARGTAPLLTLLSSEASASP